ncbi:MAG: hypothetical protein K6B46_01765 [Opitutales bacterium]|nr:hypothetical protein [Opitutales bacterium]
MRGTHTTIIEAAEELVKRLSTVAEVSPGLIDPRAKSRSRSLKISRERGGWRLEVVANSSKQQFRLYKVSLDRLKEIVSESAFKSFRKTFPEE